MPDNSLKSIDYFLVNPENPNKIELSEITPFPVKMKQKNVMVKKKID